MARAWTLVTLRSTSQVKVKSRGQRSRSPGKKKLKFSFHLTVLLVKVKGHMGQGQGSRGSRSKVTLVKLRLKLGVLTGGLTSTSSGFIITFYLKSHFLSLSLIIYNHLVQQFYIEPSFFIQEIH